MAAENSELTSQWERNLALELVRVTEAAAISAAHWMGRGDKEAVDQAAVDAMRRALDGVDMDGRVVIGEGEKDQAPMLYVGERVGNGLPPQVDVAVDPVDGTTLTALGRPGAIAVVAVADRGSMYAAPPGVYYMHKLVVSRAERDVIDINAPVAENLRRIADARHTSVENVTVTVIDRPRHQQLIADLRAARARIRSIPDGDVAAAIQAASDGEDVNVLMGIGGAPEAVLAAAAIRCLGGAIQCKISARTEEERARLRSDGIDLDRVYTAHDLVRGENIAFAATGVTGGEWLRGVRFHHDGPLTNSVMMRSRSGTVRFIEAHHRHYAHHARTEAIGNQLGYA
ncbi:MAG TPA: class II fructose-bisphosphatase [Ktedonobacterales bacterium]|nr:class II fructose-bisphosphatase [Ktedonobacterales bacterium]